MSLELSNSDPKVTAKAIFGILCLQAEDASINIPYNDFCALVWYFLTNEDLHDVDPRTQLVQDIKKLETKLGFNGELAKRVGKEHMIGRTDTLRLGNDDLPDSLSWLFNSVPPTHTQN